MTATVGIDPRLRARRIAVQRDAGRRRLRRVQTVGAVVAAFGLSFAITRSPAMDVDRVEITASGVDPAGVDEVLGDLTGSALATVDTGRIAAALAALPGVESAQVRRSWPGTVVVELTPSVPAGVVASAGGWLVVDRTGQIIAEHVDAPEGLTPIDGITVDGVVGDRLPTAYRAVASVGAALPDDLRERVAGLSADTAGVVEARLADGGRIVFQAAGDHGAAARSAGAVAATVPPGCIETIDARSAAAPVLRRSPAC